MKEPLDMTGDALPVRPSERDMNNSSSKKRVAVALMASALLDLGLAGCGGSDDIPPATVRATEFGQIDGVVETDGNTVSWRGVPFAKRP